MLSKLKNIFPSYRFSIAPMFGLTDRHCRYFLRQFSRHTLLYTEMVNTWTIIRGRYNDIIYNQEEHPIALQLGGSNLKELTKCVNLIKKYDYDEINLNVGCPSKRAQDGMFGACLMNQAQLVADCVQEISNIVSVPVTVKTRIGIDNQDSYEFLRDFIDTVSAKSKCKMFIIHARKAFLSGFSPKANCKIPPLDYSRVYKLKHDFPHLLISINGGIKSIDEVKTHLSYIDGVMVGRGVYQNPTILATVDRDIFGTTSTVTDPVTVVRSMYPYIEHELKYGTHLNQITRHMLNLFQGVPGASQWRRYLSENSYKTGADIKVLENALLLLGCKFHELQ